LGEEVDVSVSSVEPSSLNIRGLVYIWDINISSF